MKTVPIPETGEDWSNVRKMTSGNRGMRKKCIRTRQRNKNLDAGKRNLQRWKQMLLSLPPLKRRGSQLSVGI
jgi:hypothetical protein